MGAEIAGATSNFFLEGRENFIYILNVYLINYFFNYIFF